MLIENLGILWNYDPSFRFLEEISAILRINKNLMRLFGLVHAEIRKSDVF